jgi:predicted thioesterase
MTPVGDDAVGATGELRVQVTEDMSADAYGNAGLPALATPAVVGGFERAAMAALAPYVASGERSVGSVVEITHRAPTPLGAEVAFAARVVSVSGREVWFELAARCGEQVIADGRHSRFVVDDARFAARLVAPNG